MSVAVPLSARATSGHWHHDFLAVLPEIQTHAAVRFRHLPPVEREEAIAEATAAAFVNYSRLAQKQQLDQAYLSTMAGFAARHVAVGRHVGGRQTTKDVLSYRAQRRHGFTLEHLPMLGWLDDDWRQAALEDRRTSPGDLAAFHVDFADWLKQQPRRARRIINRLIAGDGTTEVAEKFGVSPARISQFRRRFERSWKLYQGEPVPA